MRILFFSKRKNPGISSVSIIIIIIIIIIITIIIIKQIKGSLYLIVEMHCVWTCIFILSTKPTGHPPKVVKRNSFTSTDIAPVFPSKILTAF